MNAANIINYYMKSKSDWWEYDFEDDVDGWFIIYYSKCNDYQLVFDQGSSASLVDGQAVGYSSEEFIQINLCDPECFNELDKFLDSIINSL